MSVHFKNRIPEIIHEIPAEVEKAVKHGADLIASGARDRVPVESGKLRDAIHTEKTDDGYAVIAGSGDAFYGHMVEHGTTHSPPHPFLTPAAEAAKEAVEGMIRDELRKL